jgi:hypothetical protein
MTDFDVEGWETDARAMPWAEVARRVATRVGPGATMRSAELAGLAIATGYSPQLLLRQVRLLAFLEAFAAKQRLDLANLITGPFTTLEAASKLFAARGGDEVAARRVKDAADRSTLTSVEALRSELRRVVGMRERAKSSSDRHVLTTHRHYRRKQAAVLLTKQGFGPLSMLEPDWSVVAPPGFTSGPVCRFSWLRSGPPIEGFDLVHLPSGTLDRAIDDRIARVLAAAAYFRLFWVVGVDGPYLRRVREGLAWAGAERVGLIIIDDPVEVEDPKLRIELQAVFGPETSSTDFLRRALASAQEKVPVIAD